MKRFVLILFLFAFYSTISNAQVLAGTEWKTKWGLPINDSIFYKFQNDTLFVTDLKKQNIFTSHYTENKDTLTLRDISGSFACDPKITGTYTFDVTGNDLLITIVLDSCQVREGAIPSKILRRKNVVSIASIDASQIELYPNPAEDFLHLKWKNPELESSIIIYNSFGQTVFKNTSLHENETHISTMDWSRGVYYLEQQMGSNKIHQKFLLK